MNVLRAKGLVSVVYLDDILIIANSEKKCYNNIQMTSRLLESLGFILNYEKSQMKPAMKCQFLGFVINSKNFTLSLSDQKRQKCLNLIKVFQKKIIFKIR